MTYMLAWICCAAAAALYLAYESRKAPLLPEHDQPAQPARCTVSMLYRGHTIMIRYDQASAGELWPAIMRSVNLIEDEACVGK